MSRIFGNGLFPQQVSFISFFAQLNYRVANQRLLAFHQQFTKSSRVEFQYSCMQFVDIISTKANNITTYLIIYLYNRKLTFFGFAGGQKSEKTIFHSPQLYGEGVGHDLFQVNTTYSG